MHFATPPNIPFVFRDRLTAIANRIGLEWQNNWTPLHETDPMPYTQYLER